ncbi:MULTISPECIES: nitroreductase [unclassified Clostridium]|uniref:nitroreductase family protein n=1 Tax=unclassified Clostridium TaxID=2614128 RepID=UPI0002980260|nr:MULTISPECIES: nitroreductase [unclassified Clostridium]EKQ52660.1 MAG: nitroreductase [Clostridium sp. Maddingley MBC34-26]
MDVIQAIEERRSIRKFQDKTIPKDIIEKILELATKAPSGKNRQPWRFVVFQNSKKNELVNIMEDALNKYKKQSKSTGSFELSINSINEASAVILVFNAFSNFEEDYNHHRLLTDIQSIGAAVQTLILAAQNFELGTLWICDIFHCDKEICSWLNRKDELVAAVAIGYPNQKPYSRPRKLLEEVIEWM